MKRYFLFFVLALFILSSHTEAQWFKFSNAKISYGQSPFFSSFNAEGTFEKQGRKLVGAVNETRGYTKYGIVFPHITLFASGGIQNKAPWLGPEADFSFWKFSTLHWTGWMFGYLDEESKKYLPRWQNPHYFFALNAIYLSQEFLKGKITISHTVFHKPNQKPDHMPGISLQLPFGENGNFSWSIGGDYSLLHQSPLFNMSLKYIP
ncbi:MAG: hypothetical protein PHZ04_03310 [Patescibacteria group bacterium]|nr:hypothetical protein [Patescibacteria group bacterium]MDD5295012.1 hypothetical protein [Patescibacteria group bacterium]MDD5554200.1 hypothetical protein [Patescibacteria group bacterium]